MRKTGLALIAAVVCSGGCNSVDGTRFNDQEAYYTLSSGSMTLTAYGASSTHDDTTKSFRCPSVSGMSRETNVSSFELRANSLTPHFVLDTINGIRSDTASPVGISLSNLPMGMLDIYKRCQATSSEQYVIACPSNYTIVDSCESALDASTSCELVYEGTHELVISSMVNENESCYTEENDRSAYTSAIDAVYACDAFSPTPLMGVFRGVAPVNNCCSESTPGPTLDFCFKPCGCRKLTIQMLPKKSMIEAPSQNSAAPVAAQPFDSTLKIAVFSNVEGNKSTFRKILNDAKAHDVDVAISLGNLTSSGTKSEFRDMREIADEILSPVDGASCAQTSEDADDVDYCCENGERQLPFFCNARLDAIPLIVGLGESEADGKGLSAYREYFGVSNVATVIGKVELLMIDTADATLSGAEKNWIKKVFPEYDTEDCLLSSKNDNWPILADCVRDGYSTCRECIGEEAYCVPPTEDKSDMARGPMNCVCIPATSGLCHKNHACQMTSSTEGTCACSRDMDCGVGGTCSNGVCKLPLRFVFSYTPLFDEYGSRNNALAREDGAALLSIFAKAGTAAIFSGRVLDYSSFTKAGIPFYFTGGGGAEMCAFSDYSHHWLLVEVPNAYTDPDDYQVTVMEI